MVRSARVVLLVVGFEPFFFFFFTLITGPSRSLSLKLSDTRVYEPQIRARLGTATHFCPVQFSILSLGIRVRGLGFRVQGLWFRVEVSGFMVEVVGLRV